MIVVSDTSPITSLSQIGRLDLLQSLFEIVVIPSEVERELRRGHVALPDWVETREASDAPLIARLETELDRGEAEALALAVEVNADLVLIDEQRGRLVAERLGLRFIGVLGVVLEAKRRGKIAAVSSVLDDLVTTAGFWIADDLRLAVLKAAGET